MNNVEKLYCVTESQCRKDGIIKMSSLFLMLQDIAADHVEELGYGRDVVVGNGMIWVVSNQAAEIKRLPRIGEEIVIRTWAEKPKMMFFPRRYQVLSKDGDTIIEAGAMWALIDIKNRKVISPKAKGVDIGYCANEDSEILHLKPHAIPTTEQCNFTIPHSFIDSNGHMNNAKYFDIADIVLGEAAEGRAPKRVIARYSKEAFENDVLTVSWGAEDLNYYLSCESAQGNHIKMQITY